MTALPRIMVAPNGARRGKADHPALPVTLAELVTDARACRAAGADGLHLHLRDGDGRHLLDAGAYREALAALAEALPGWPVQITTEAVGRYSPAHQRQIARSSGARAISIALREMLAEGETLAAANLYRDLSADGVDVQHIVYSADEVDQLAQLLPTDMLRAPSLQVLFVLGRYTSGQTSDPSMLIPFLDRLAWYGLTPDWAVCAFGQGETACLLAARAAGGKMRVGFENSLVHPDGQIARDNADRVTALIAALADQNRRP